MNKIKVINEVEISFIEVIQHYEKSDVSSMVQIISDHFENYDVDVDILNKMVSIILSCGPNKDDLNTVDVDRIKELLKIIE